MKRMTAMLLTLGLLSAALTGCQGGATTPKTEALAEVTVGSDTSGSDRPSSTSTSKLKRRSARVLAATSSGVTAPFSW